MRPTTDRPPAGELSALSVPRWRLRLLWVLVSVFALALSLSFLGLVLS
jgi:hypothetical protein